MKDILNWVQVSEEPLDINTDMADLGSTILVRVRVWDEHDGKVVHTSMVSVNRKDISQEIRDFLREANDAE